MEIKCFVIFMELLLIMYAGVQMQENQGQNDQNAHNVTGCVSLQNPENGHVDLSAGTSVGAIATYSCNAGYTLFGAPSSTCGGPVVKKKPLYIMPCLCNTQKTFAGMTNDEIIALLVKETAIDTKNTSASMNKLAGHLQL